MDATQENLVNALPCALPQERLSAELVQILADDRLIEAIRTDRLTGDDLVSPLVRMLASWRT